MASRLDRISRAQKAKLSAQIGDNLKARAKAGPAEPALDAFIPACDSLAARLVGHVDGKDEALAAHGARVYLLEVADGGVDTWLRHVENYLDAEGRRRHGPHAPAARALHDSAFPRGLAFLDDAVGEENVVGRSILAMLRAPEHQDTLAAIQLPMVWLDRLQEALQESEEALTQLQATREDKRGHIDLGRSVEEEFVDVMARLRNYVLFGRASKKDAEKRNEGRALIAPLIAQLALMKAESAARKTRKASGKNTPPPEASEKPVVASEKPAKRSPRDAQGR